MISVIIPAYNQARYLPDSLNSILNQSFTDWECLVINDGSIDNTHEVVNAYLSKSEKIKYIEQPNKGLAATRNRGLEESSGTYIQFLDADDTIHHTKLEKQHTLLSKTNNLALSYTDYFSSTEYDLTCPYPGRRYLPPTFIGNNKLHDLIIRWEQEMSIPVHCFLFDARFFRDHQIRFDESLPNHEDWDCWMNIFKLNPEIYFIRDNLATYRIHSDSMVYNRDQMREGYIKALLKQRNTFTAASPEYALLTRKIDLVEKAYNPSILTRFINLMQNIYSSRRNLRIPIR